MARLSTRQRAQLAAQLAAQPASAGSQPAAPQGPAPLPSYKKGGSVEKSGPAMLHKGEEVLNAKAARRYRRGARG